MGRISYGKFKSPFYGTDLKSVVLFGLLRQEYGLKFILLFAAEHNLKSVFSSWVPDMT